MSFIGGVGPGVMQRAMQSARHRLSAMQSARHLLRAMQSARHRLSAMQHARHGLSLITGAVYCMGCTRAMSVSPQTDVSTQPINRLLVFVRDWPRDNVEIDLTRRVGGSTLIMYRPAQPAEVGRPARRRVLLDSIGPVSEEPQEIVQLLNTFDVWAMADSNAVGAACNTRRHYWVCHPTFNDYTLVMQVIRGGVSRSQRYTRLQDSTSSKAARALGDFILAWKGHIKRTPTQTGRTL